MAVGPVIKPSRIDTSRLMPFDARCAERVVSWVRDARETYWLAPRTEPPLTTEKVRAWAGPGRDPLMLVTSEQPEPLAYGELNILNEKRREYWLGHLVVDPRRRGQGVGRRLTELLLRRAFHLREAQRVSLVVFPENAAAIACYRAAGMYEDGFETHHFAAYRRRERLLRLVAARALK
jgi:RimJ/RimL family protein N-acetyltransferase